MRLYRNAMILLVVLAGLYGVYYWSSNNKSETENTEDKTITIFEESKDNLAEIEITNQNGLLGFKKDGEDWKLNPFKDINLVESKVDGLIYDVANIKAEKLIEKDAKDLTAYGLDRPKATISVKIKDGNEKIFYLGDPTPSKSNYYFKEKNGSKVYTIYSYKAEAFSKGLDEYRERTVLDIKADDIREISVEGKNITKIVIKAKEVKNDEKAEDKDNIPTGTLSSWDMLEPYKRNVDNEKLQQLVFTKLQGINAEEFVDDEPNDLAQYGLDNPQYTARFVDSSGKATSVLLGYSTGDYIYLKIADRKPVYLVKTTSFEYKDIDAFTFIEKFAYIVNIDIVDKIVVEAGGKKNTLEIKHNPEEDKEDSYKVNGKDAEESAFKKLYQDVIGLIVDGPLSGKEDIEAGEVVASCTFYHNNKTKEVIVKYVSIDDRRCAVVINGKSEFFILKKKVTAMLDSIKEFDK